MEKLIVISAPSGAGKTSIAHYLLKQKSEEIAFSISACSRARREDEVYGKDYYFLSVEEFKNKIKQEAFLEWEEVYKNQYYGTLKSEVERIWKEQKTVILDLDVDGALNIKKQYSNTCLSIFIMPPSIDALKQRLEARGSESQESLHKRLEKAVSEIDKHDQFDQVILNDDFLLACKTTLSVVNQFIEKK